MTLSPLHLDLVQSLKEYKMDLHANNLLLVCGVPNILFSFIPMTVGTQREIPSMTTESTLASDVERHVQVSIPNQATKASILRSNDIYPTLHYLSGHMRAGANEKSTQRPCRSATRDANKPFRSRFRVSVVTVLFHLSLDPPRLTFNDRSRSRDRVEETHDTWHNVDTTTNIDIPHLTFKDKQWNSRGRRRPAHGVSSNA